MPAPVTAVDFFVAVRKSELVPAAVLERRAATWAGLADSVEVAKAFVAEKLLTKFQARLILAGRYRGFRVGPYVIRDEIGKGGMGAVYLAEHSALQRRAALKVLLADKVDRPGAKERFFREARAAAAIDHPNVVRVFDVLLAGGTFYLVMEYVDGFPLDKVLAARKSLPVAAAVGYVAQAAAGLQYAHDLGLIHRDIKPANIMVNRKGLVKLLDLGLARSVDHDDGLTGKMDKGAVLGTADFVAPEQALHGTAVDGRADLYSLGATLFTLLTGQPVFPGNLAQKLMHHQRTPPRRITDLDATLPPALADVVAVMLNKHPDDRYQSAAEVIDALAPWLPAAAPPAGLSGVGIAPMSADTLAGSSVTTRPLHRPETDPVST